MKKYSTVDDIDSIAYEQDLKVVEVTQGMNGYPSHLYKALTDFASFEDAKACADAIGGEVVCLHQKAGWQLWDNKGTQFEPFDLATYYEDKDSYEVINPDDYSSMEAFVESRDVKGCLSDKDDIDDMLAFLEKEKGIWEAYCNLHDSEFLLINHSGQYMEVMDIHPTAYCYDGDTYTYGVVKYENWY